MSSTSDKKIKLDVHSDWFTWDIAFVARASLLWEKIGGKADTPRPMTERGRQRYKLDLDTYLVDLEEFTM